VKLHAAELTCEVRDNLFLGQVNLFLKCYGDKLHKSDIHLFAFPQERYDITLLSVVFAIEGLYFSPKNPGRFPCYVFYRACLSDYYEIMGAEGADKAVFEIIRYALRYGFTFAILTREIAYSPILG